MRQGVVLLAVLMCGNASAQVVYKCVDRTGAVSYQNDPCPATSKQPKLWNAPPEPPPSNAELWRRHNERVQGEADSRYLSRLAGTDRPRSSGGGHVIQQQKPDNSMACESAKAYRKSVLESAGLNRTYDLLQKLDEGVREACK